MTYFTITITPFYSLVNSLKACRNRVYWLYSKHCTKSAKGLFVRDFENFTKYKWIRLQKNRVIQIFFRMEQHKTPAFQLS